MGNRTWKEEGLLQNIFKKGVVWLQFKNNGAWKKFYKRGMSENEAPWNPITTVSTSIKKLSQQEFLKYITLVFEEKKLHQFEMKR